MPFFDCIQSTDMYIMQSENGILLLFYIFLSHGNEKKNEKGGDGRVWKGGGMLCPVHKYLWNILVNLPCFQQ